MYNFFMIYIDLFVHIPNNYLYIMCLLDPLVHMNPYTDPCMDPYRDPSMDPYLGPDMDLCMNP